MHGNIERPRSCYHLHRARLFQDPTALAAAAHLFRTLGYARRNAELADAEAALGEKP